MTILSAFFVASRADARAYMDGNFDVVASELTVDCGGLTDLEISQLYAIAEGAEFDFDRHEFEPILDADASLLYKLPKKFIKALCDLDDEAIVSACEQWSKTDEMNGDPDTLVPLVQAVIRIAKSISKGTDLYFYCSS